MTTKERESADMNVKNFQFSGKKADWVHWEEKFLARAKRKGLKELFLGKGETQVPKASEDVKEDKAKKDVLDLNEIAYGDLIMCMETSTTAGKIAFNLVKSSKNKDYPDGNATVSFKKLKDKYASESAPNVSKLYNQFYTSKLKKNQDPDVWVMYLEEIRLRLEEMESKAPMTDDQFLRFVLNNLNPDYDILVDLLARRIGCEKDPLSIDELRSELNLRYDRMRTRKDDDIPEDKGEHALFAGGKFKGKCRNCGKWGHKAKDCDDRDSKKGTNTQQGKRNSNFNSRNGNGTSTFKGKCYTCNQYGHKSPDCPTKNKTPDSANIVAEDEEEVALITCDVPEYVMVNDFEYLPNCAIVDKIVLPSEFEDKPKEVHGCHACGHKGHTRPTCMRTQMSTGNKFQWADWCSESSDEETTESEHEEEISLAENEEDDWVCTAPSTAWINKDGVWYFDIAQAYEAYEEEEEEVLLLMGDFDEEYEDDEDEDGESLEFGTCPMCGDDGPIGYYCSECDVDTNMIYTSDAVVSTILEEDEESVMAFSEISYKVHLKSQVRYYISRTDPEVDVEKFLSLVSSNLQKEQPVHLKRYFRSRMKVLEEMGIKTVRDIILSLHIIKVMTDKGFEMSDTEYDVILECGTEWLMNMYIHVPPPDSALMACDTMYDTAALHGCLKKIDNPKHIWMGDSGASCHMTCDDKGMYDTSTINSPIRIGNGTTLRATKIGKKRLTVYQQDGSTTNIVLEGCKFVPGLWTNLFSITKALEHKWSISNDGLIISVRKDKIKITFDKIMPTHSGNLIGVEMRPRLDLDAALVVFEPGREFDVNTLHAILGHVNEDVVRRTAAYYGIKVTGKFAPCFTCAMSNIKRKPIKKTTTNKSFKPGERLFMDTGSIRSVSFGGSKYWILLVDDFSGYCWSLFVRQKSQLAERVQTLLNKIKIDSDNRITVKKIRCDNAGENISLSNMLMKEGLNITFEFTSPGCPQFNGKVERKFATLFGRVRALFNEAKLSPQLRGGLWTEAAKFATDIENILVTKNRTKSPTELFLGIKALQQGKLRKFGELVVVPTKSSPNQIMGKLQDRGKPCIYLSHAEYHGQDVCRLLNLATNKVIMTRNITWLNKTYHDWREYANIIPRTLEENEEDDDADSTGLEDVNITENDELVDLQVNDNDEEISVNDVIVDPPQPEIINIEDEQEVQVQEDETIVPVMINNPTGHVPNTRLVRELRRLDGFFNPTATEIVQAAQNVERNVEDTVPTAVNQADEDDEFAGRQPDAANIMVDKFLFLNLEHCDYALLTGDLKNLLPSQYKDVYSVPATFAQAWNHPDPWQRSMWRAAITKELTKMQNQKVWVVVKKVDIPSGRQCIKHKWVFDIKRDGIFRARLVACGYSQVPGVDFQESYSPVINDVVFRILIVYQITMKYPAVVLDVEVAFLNGDLEETIYMEMPKGIETDGTEAVLLQKSMYGLVQAARQFFKKFTQVLKKIGFSQSYAEPCLFIRQNKQKEFLLLVVHVDDCYIVGNLNEVERLVKDIEANGLKVKVSYNTSDYLSCEIVHNKDQQRAWLGQPHLVKKLEKSFGHLVEKLQVYKTPGTPGQGLVRPAEGDAAISDEKQKTYRSAVGTLLQFTKYSRPDISNAVRELSKCMDKANEAAYKEMQRIIKFVLDTKHYGLLIEPKSEFNAPWHLKVYTDSDWAGDKNNRRSVSGFVIFLLGVPILWRSRLQKTVSLSSSEAEYYALSEAAKEIKFVVQILESIGIKVQMPIVVCVDNVGAIFMSENVSATSRTKHVDARYHYVREFVEDGFIKIVFVKSKENKSDIFTKNVTQDIYSLHVTNYVISKEKLTDKNEEG